MRAAVIVLVALPACGRIGFDGTSPDAGGTSIRATISSAPGVTVVALDARFTFAALDPDELHGIMAPLPADAVYPLPDTSGPLTMTVSAVDAVGRRLAAAASTEVTVFDQATVAIVIGADLTASCTNGVADPGETGIDCGGGCPACGVGGSCLAAGDCVTGNCVANSCEPVSGPPIWQPIHDMPLGRIGPGAALGGDGLMYVFGGAAYDMAVPTTEVDVYQGGTDTWLGAPPMLTASYRLAYVTAADGSVYAIGGNNGGSIATVESFTPGATQWVARPSLPTARHDLIAARDAQGTIYAIGGYDDITVLGDVYALAGGTWLAHNPMPTPRSNLGIAVLADGTLLAIGGHNGVGTVHYATVEGYDPVHDAWRTYPALNHMRSDFAAVTAPDGRAYAVSGYDGTGILTSVEAYRPGANAWLDVTPVMTGRDTNAVAVGSDGRVLVFGGKLGTSMAYATVEAYGPELVLGAVSGASGDPVVISGHFFGASANVRVYFDDTPIELAATDANGTLGPVTVHVPIVVPGPHVVRAIDDRSGYPVTQPFVIQ